MLPRRLPADPHPMTHPDGLRPTPRTAATLSLLGACAIAAGCGMPTVRADGSHFIVVRHAEKADDGTRDPPLSTRGLVRAHALARQLDDTPLAAVYATPLQRARQTAGPAAQAQRVPVVTYPADMAAARFADRLRRDHVHGNVLVVGHGNTVPDIVSALCAWPVAAINEGAYGGRYDVRIDASGSATLIEGRY